MARFFEKIRSFSGDYSGAAGVLNALDGMLIFCDAGACMGGYIYAEDPIGGNEDRAVFSASLREKQIVMGVDKKLKDDAVRTYREVGGRFISLIGTPVSSVIGVDHTGLGKDIARQLFEEKETEKLLPVISVDTNGWEMYDAGQEKAYLALVENIVEPDTNTAIDVNVIGAAPIDMWDYNQIDDCIRFLKEAGAAAPCVWGGNGGIDEIKGAAGAKLNIAVSVSAIKAVKELQKRYGTPYLIGYPTGRSQTAEWRQMISDILQGKEVAKSRREVKRTGKRALIIYEQVTACMLRELMMREFDYEVVDVATFFQMRKELKEPGDFQIKEERVLAEYLAQRERYDLIIADPFCTKVFSYEPEKKIMLPHIGVSSVFYANESPNLFGEKGSDFFENLLADSE